jgi:predicted AAA+ superfamily ATPase
VDHDEIAKRTAQMISASDVADHVDTDAIRDSVIEAIDTDDIAEKAAENIDLASLASNIEGISLAEHIDLSDLAGSLDHGELVKNIDLDDIDRAVNDVLCNGDDMIDYATLAKALISQFAKAKA